MQNQISQRPGSDLPPNIVKTLRAMEKAQLAELLSQCCALQKQYGKTPAELETLVEGFSWALADYTMQQIITAMREYVRNASDIPAPADIIKIIEAEREKNKPVPLTEFKIETLRRFQEMGISLTPEQQAKLDAA